MLATSTTTKPLIIRVAIARHIYHLFDYLINEDHHAILPVVGGRVCVPFSNQYLIAIVIEITDQSELDQGRLRPVSKIIDDKPLIEKQVFELCRWASQYYHQPLGEVLFSAIPKKLRLGHKAIIQQQDYIALSVAGRQMANETQKTPLKAFRQQQLLNSLKEIKTMVAKEKLIKQGTNQAVIDAANKKGWLRIDKRPKTIVNCHNKQSIPPPLNQAQSDAVSAINKATGQFNTFLLEGVTGSGKTEVYLNVIEYNLKKQQQALVLVPEIGLTPQMLARFQQRFNKTTIALFHSQLNDTQRCQNWLLAKAGYAKIIIGTRSAVFIPARQLGIIIIDESHDLSYKQQDGFRYSGRDLAIIRAKKENIPIVMGSATPAFESLHNVQKQRYHHLLLSKRISTHPLAFHVINMRGQSSKGGLSKDLTSAITKHLKVGNQVLLFLNQRGFAPVLMCHHCGFVMDCQHCQSPMVFHQQMNYLCCHHCHHKQAKPTHCPQCNKASIQPIGVGTERLELTLKAYFPKTAIIRIDKDTTRRKNDLPHYLQQIQQGKKQILIGTQMLAKGHHFPNVTMVGIINADGGFFSADFRAVERMGQLLIQVAGRAGRSEKKGEVYIQTHHPDHKLLKTLIKQGYPSFARLALQQRNSCQLPPFSYLALLRAEAKKPEMGLNFLERVKQIAEQLDYCLQGNHGQEECTNHKDNRVIQINQTNRVTILGPIMAPHAKRAGFYRTQLLIQSGNRTMIQLFLTKLTIKINKMAMCRKVRWSIDVDPLEMF